MRLQRWLDNDLITRFDRRIIGVDHKVAQRRGKLVAQSEKSGQRVHVIDGLIAAAGLVYDMVVVTRDTADMAVSGVKIHNPWDA